MVNVVYHQGHTRHFVKMLQPILNRSVCHELRHVIALLECQHIDCHCCEEKITAAAFVAVASELLVCVTFYHRQGCR